MRRKGFYASLRSTITYQSKVSTATYRDGSIRLKLFNLIMTDIGPTLLERGIYIPAHNIREFFKSLEDRFFESILISSIDGQPVDAGVFRSDDSGTHSEWIELKICTLK
jgi:hypothetical protein